MISDESAAAGTEEECQEGGFVVKSISGPIPCSFPVPHQPVHYVLAGHKLDPNESYLLMESTRLELLNCATGRVSFIAGPGEIRFEGDGEAEGSGAWIPSGE